MSGTGTRCPVEYTLVVNADVLDTITVEGTKCNTTKGAQEALQRHMQKVEQTTGFRYLSACSVSVPSQARMA